MVKPLDDKHPLLPEHVGVDLWRAATAWRDRFHAEMVERGHTWMGDARGSIATHLDPDGLSQAELVRRMGVSKQAVQQLVDALEAEGIVRREADPNDGRGRRVVYTERGVASLRDGVKVKRAIEAEYKKRLGVRSYAALVEALAKLVAPPEG